MISKKFKSKIKLLYIFIPLVAILLAVFYLFFQKPEFRRQPHRNSELSPFRTSVACKYIKEFEIINDRNVLKKYTQLNLDMSSQSNSEGFKLQLPQTPNSRTVYISNYDAWKKLPDQIKINMMSDLVTQFNIQKLNYFDIDFITCKGNEDKWIGFVNEFNGEKKVYFDWDN